MYMSCELSYFRTNLRRTTLLVLYDTDLMVYMGFETQLRAILDQVRPDAQILLGSSTWPITVRRLTEDFMNEHIRVNVSLVTEQYKDNIGTFIEVNDGHKSICTDMYSHLFLDNEYPVTDSLRKWNNRLDHKRDMNFTLDLKNTKYATLNLWNDFLDSSSKLSDSCIIRKGSKCEIKRKTSQKNKPLNKKAVEIMEKWYVKHINFPYPEYNEKNKLATQGSIHIAQVT